MMVCRGVNRLLDEVQRVVERRAGGDAMWSEIRNLPWVALALLQQREVDSVLRALRNMEGWKEIANGDGIRTYYRNEEGSPIQRLV
jgi:hypothetical protein